MNFIYDRYSHHLRWLDKAYFAEKNAVITVPPISDKDMEENCITVTLGGKAVRISGNDLRLAEERPQIEEEEVLLSCPVCGANPDSLMLELVWIADSIGWQGVCTCPVCGTESIGNTSLYEDKALAEAKHTWNEGFVHIRRNRHDTAESREGEKMNQERVARGIVDVQASAYDFFGIDSWPEDEEFSKRIEAWMEDQIRKCSWTDMIDEKAIDVAEDKGASSAAKAARRFL